MANADIVIANAPSAPDPEPATGTLASPGVDSPDISDYGSGQFDSAEEMDFFFDDKPINPAKQEAPSEPVDKELSTPKATAAPETPKPPAEPEAKRGAPNSTPASPLVIDPNLIGIAETYGMTKAEAESYGDPAHLLRTLNILARTKSPTGTPAAADTKPPPPVPVKEIDFPDMEKIGELGLDPEVTKLFTATKAMYDRMVAHEAQVKEVLPTLVEDTRRRQHEEGRRQVASDFKEAGYDYDAIDPAIVGKVVARVAALHQTYKAEGIKPPTVDLIRAIVPVVAPEAKRLTNGTPDPVESRRQRAIEQAKVMQRHTDGTFRGMPTHRRGGNEVKGAALRQTMLDKGYDPGPAQTGDDTTGFLKG